ncbi:MAG: secretin N-terminal domain-containing protein [Pseudomonadota bacterium]
MSRRLLPLLGLLAPVVLAQGSLEVIPLRHRTAEQVIPVLRPLLEPGGALSGQYSQLIVRTSPANLAQIRAALEAIDRPLRRLVISVRFDSLEDSAASAIRGEARISNRGSSAEVRIRDSRSALGERVDQRIQVLEGGRALIASGESRPLRQREVLQTPGGPVIRETTVMQGAATGFEVVPRLSGTSVVLEIAPQREQFVPGGRGAVQSERAVSSVSGRLGEWLEIGGAASAAARQEAGILGSREARSSAERRIWVKVEEVPN